VPGAAALLGAPLDAPGLPEGDRDLGHDEPDRAIRTSDGRDDGIVLAVLRRDDVAIGPEARKGHVRRPRRVVGLDRYECDVEAGPEPLRLVDVERRRPRLEGLVRPGHAEAAG